MATNAPSHPMFGEISIIHKSYKFYLLLYSYTSLFPKKDRYTIGQKCEQLSLEFLELLFEANSTTGRQRLLLLKKLDNKLKVLKTMIRICFDIKAFDQRKYIHCEESLQEIGKMLGGWIKSTKNPKQENLAI